MKEKVKVKARRVSDPWLARAEVGLLRPSAPEVGRRTLKWVSQVQVLPSVHVEFNTGALRPQVLAT